MLRGDREAEHRKPKAARSGKELMDAESDNQEAPVDASHEIEGSRGCTGLNSIKDNSEKANRQLCSISRAISEKGDAPDIGV
ncbi:hypothetical protein NL676_005237 [Syzygium grande]|nr:hypothetical protein NL676_005237 [Syzygium grande]